MMPAFRHQRKKKENPFQWPTIYNLAQTFRGCRSFNHPQLVWIALLGILHIISCRTSFVTQAYTNFIVAMVFHRLKRSQIPSERPWQNFCNSGIRDHMINSDVIHPLVFNTQSCDSKPRHVLAGWSMSTWSHVQVRSWRRRTAPRMWLGTGLIPWTYEPKWES